MDLTRAGLLRRLFGAGGRELPATGNGRDPVMHARYRQALRDSHQASLWELTLPDIRYIVVDTETTGFNPAADHLLSIAAVEVQGKDWTGRVFNSYTALPPGAAIPEVVQELTGIRPEHVQDAPAPEEVLAEFLDFLNGDVLIAHFARHDVNFINAYLRRAGQSELENRVIDTANVFQWVYGLPEPPPLEVLLSRYSIQAESRHTALGDAGMTGRVWQRLMEEAMAKGIGTLGDLMEALVVSSRQKNNG